MSQASSVALAVVDDDHRGPARANVSLRGTTRGLEILISAAPSAAALGARLAELLSEAPSFFAGSDARVAFEGALPAGALACLEDTATRFELRIVEIGPVPVKRRAYASLVRRDARRGKLAEGSGPVTEQAAGPAHDAALATSDDAAHASAPSDGTPAVATTSSEIDASAIASSAIDASTTAASTTAATTITASTIAASATTASATAASAIDASAIDPSALDVSAIDPGAVEAAPIEIALANTAPYTALLITATLPAGEPPSALASAPVAPAVAPLAMDGAPAVAPLAMDGAPAVGAGLVEVAQAAELREPELSPADAAAIEAALACAVPVLTAAGAAELPALAAELPALDVAPPSTPDVPQAPDPAATAAAIAAAAATLAAELVAAMPPGPRLVIGPVRSGVIVDHTGHVIVIGDVNPGAEVRAEGSIIVLGRLRGVAHAAIGRDAGCIIALALAPQQLRIGRMVARAADTDRPSGVAEIAYVTGETIVVERFTGRLPSGLAASM